MDGALIKLLIRATIRRVCDLREEHTLIKFEDRLKSVLRTKLNIRHVCGEEETEF